MPKVTFINAAGDEKTLDVEAGTNLMQAAMENGIEEIIAECGGACSCATCHCYLEPGWIDKPAQPDEMETALLECVLEPQDGSRLSCQIIVDDALDGIRVRLPESQF